jgi:hypothetical protein
MNTKRKLRQGKIMKKEDVMQTFTTTTAKFLTNTIIFFFWFTVILLIFYFGIHATMSYLEYAERSRDHHMVLLQNKIGEAETLISDYRTRFYSSKKNAEKAIIRKLVIDTIIERDLQVKHLSANSRRFFSDIMGSDLLTTK